MRNLLNTFIIWLITGPRHFRGTGLLHWIASALKTNLSFKQRNAFYKNEAIIRLSSHHTMQRKPEDRVLPYNGQNMLDTSKTNHLILLLVFICFKNNFNHNYQS